MRIDDFLSHFKGVVPNGLNRWKAICPAHQDNKPSLAIALGGSGRIVCRCHAGCDTDTAILAAGLSMSDLFDSGSSSAGVRSRREELSAATRATRHEVYTLLLKECPLNLEHMQEVARRFGDKALLELGYGSLTQPAVISAIKKIRKLFSTDVITSVPGFVKDPFGNLKLVRDSGLMIPVRDVDGNIIAIQLRTEDEDGKYKWLSASENSSGSPCHIPISYIRPPGTQVVRITEGPLKADAAQVLDSSVLTLGVAGVSSWQSCIPVILALEPEHIRLAFDSDWRTKPQVKLALTEMFQYFMEQGLDVSVEVWDSDYKGIDDLLLAGQLPILGGQEQVQLTLEEEFEKDCQGIILLNAEDIQAKAISWLWDQWLPYGAFATLDGDPNEGKSTFTCSLAAHVTNSVILPAHEPLVCPKSVLLVACEDDKNNTWKPRLVAAGVNCSMVEFWDGNRDKENRRWLPNLPADLRKLEYIIRKINCGLVVIDPLYSFIDGKYDSWKDQHMKLVLNMLADLASRTGACILGIRHFNKAVNLPSLYRGMGSIGVIGVARAGLAIVRDQEDEDTRYLCQVKGNINKPQNPWKFRIDSVGESSKITWLEQEARSLKELSSANKEPISAQAAQFIAVALAEKDVPASEMYMAADRMEISKRSLDRAKAGMGVGSYKEQDIWYWGMTNGKSK